MLTSNFNFQILIKYWSFWFIKNLIFTFIFEEFLVFFVLLLMWILEFLSFFQNQTQIAYSLTTSFSLSIFCFLLICFESTKYKRKSSSVCRRVNVRSLNASEKHWYFLFSFAFKCTQAYIADIRKKQLGFTGESSSSHRISYVM
jgi:hypothetical protein